jgi:hypothetical protein
MEGHTVRFIMFSCMMTTKYALCSILWWSCGAGHTEVVAKVRGTQLVSKRTVPKAAGGTSNAGRSRSRHDSGSSRQVFHVGGPGSRPSRSTWDLWLTEWHWDRFFPEAFNFLPISIILLPLRIHACTVGGGGGVGGWWTPGPLAAAVAQSVLPNHKSKENGRLKRGDPSGGIIYGAYFLIILSLILSYTFRYFIFPQSHTHV